MSFAPSELNYPPSPKRDGQCRLHTRRSLASKATLESALRLGNKLTSLCDESYFCELIAHTNSESLSVYTVCVHVEKVWNAVIGAL